MINWKMFGILFFAIFSSMLGQGIIIPVLPVYANELGATAFHIGLIFGAYSLSMSLLFPYIGRLSDLYGRKPFIMYGLLFYSLISVIFTFAADVNSLVCIRFLQGIGATMIMPVAEAYAGEITPRGKEGTVMGLIGVAFVAALGLGPLMGGITRDAFGVNVSFISVAVVSSLGFVVCTVFLPSAKDEHTRVKKSVPYKELLSDKYITGLFLFRLTYTMCVGMIWSFAPLIAETQYELSGLAVGTIIALGVFVSAGLMTPMGMAADRFNKRILIILGGLVTVIAMVLFTRMSEPWEFYMVSVLLGIGDGISMPAVMAMTVVLGRKRNSMGTIVSLLTMTEPVGMILGPVLAGFLISLSDTAVTFGGGAVMMMSATVLMFFLTAGFYTLERCTVQVE